jgi:YidC/Oxa1 family membrane protein insertase
MPTTANIRIFLWVLLATAVFLNVETWTRDYAGVDAAPTASPTSATGSLDTGAPLAGAPVDASHGASPAIARPGAPVIAGAPGIAEDAGNAIAGGAQAAAGAPSAASVHVVTDVLDVEVSLLGGELTRADLLAYPQAKNTPNLPVRLLNRDSPESLFVVETGLAGTSGESAPTHQTLLTSDVRELRLEPGQDQVQLPLQWSDGHGVTVTKTLKFRRGAYQIDVDYQIRNAGAAPWSFAPYTRILRYNEPIPKSYFRVDSYAFKGPSIWNGRKYQKLDISKGATLDETVTDGWIAAQQQHFVVAAVPAHDDPNHFDLKIAGMQFLLSATGSGQSVAPGASTSVQEKLWVGPKLQSQLDQVGPSLSLIADYGQLSVLAKPLFWLLEHVHGIVGNWGFTIIIVTLLLKLLFYPLSEASGRSMAKMKALGPRLTTLRETYKDDREKLNRAMMELYQREKVNPLAGCLPMLIQIPVFLAFYWVLRDSVEIRQAPFVLWINDLSARDPAFVLPAIMAGAMFVQYKLNPQVGDPMQQKVFMFMPLAMSATFAFFPAGLVLYWVTNTVLSILQQWNINRRIGAAPRSKR